MGSPPPIATLPSWRPTSNSCNRRFIMDFGAGVRKVAIGALAISSFLLAGDVTSAHAQAATSAKPNVLFIMADDIGWMQPSIYHRGLMVGETPNIDRIGHEGAIFMDYLGMQSCTSGRNAFFTGMYPLRTGMIPPQLPGSPSYLRQGTPTLAVFLRDLGYPTGEFGKNHLGDHTESLPTAHGFQEYWGYLYHLDAMQQVSFQDINSSTAVQAIAPPCKNTPIPGLQDVPGAVDPRTTICLTPPRPVIWCNSSDGTLKNQTCKDQGPLTLERSKTVDEEISAKVVDFLDRNDPKKTVPHPRIGSVWAASPSGKPSKSLAKVILRATSTTTFEVSLNSGRPHQIRIHLASIGHPLVGDPLYGLAGQPLENLPGLPGDGGYFLHAQFLKFHHPITGEQINLEAALPSGFSLHQ